MPALSLLIIVFLFFITLQSLLKLLAADLKCSNMTVEYAYRCSPTPRPSFTHLACGNSPILLVLHAQIFHTFSYKLAHFCFTCSPYISLKLRQLQLRFTHFFSLELGSYALLVGFADYAFPSFNVVSFNTVSAIETNTMVKALKRGD